MNQQVEAQVWDKPHVLVVDDDNRLRELIRKYLSDHGFYVSSAISAKDAREKLGLFAFDLMVLDIMMPGESGLDLARSIRSAQNPLPILMLTAMGEPDQRIDGLMTGADDYLTKPFEPRELVLRISSILRRVVDKKQQGQQVRFGGFQFDMRNGQLTHGNEQVYLTSNEQLLLKVLAEHAGTALSRERLIELSAIGGGERNVDVQITRLRKKIEPHSSRPRYLQTVRGMGYMLQAE